MSPRPIEYDYDQVLEQATHLFWEKGYRQTSIRDLLSATGFNRHSLYEAFGGKEGIFAASLQFYKRKYTDALITRLLSADSDIETLRQIFRQRAIMDKNRLGCLISNTSNEKHCIDQKLHAIAQRCNHELENAIQVCIRHAKEKGQVPQEKDTQLLARYMMALLHGLGPLSKNGLTQKDSVAMGELYLQTLTA